MKELWSGVLCAFILEFTVRLLCLRLGIWRVNCRNKKLINAFKKRKKLQKQMTCCVYHRKLKED